LDGADGGCEVVDDGAPAASGDCGDVAFTIASILFGSIKN